MTWQPIETTPYDVAKTFLGVTERPGAEDNPLIVAALSEVAEWRAEGILEHDETAWCAAFAAFVCRRLGLPHPQGWSRLRARAWLTVGREVQEPEVGPDIVIFSRGRPESGKGHVGFFGGWGEGRRTVLTLGGNQGNAVSLAPYAADRVLGFRRLLPDAEPAPVAHHGCVQEQFLREHSAIFERLAEIAAWNTTPRVEPVAQD